MVTFSLGAVNGLSNGRVLLTTSNGSAHDNVLGTKVLVKDTWYHVVAVWSPVYKAIYINGIVDKDGSPSNSEIKINNLNANIGGRGNNYQFNGLIDEVRIYNEALTSAQIQKLYAEGVERHRIVFNEK